MGARTHQSTRDLRRCSGAQQPNPNAGRPARVDRYPGWLWTYGLPDYVRKGDDDKRILTGDPSALDLVKKYGVDYVMIGPQEIPLGAAAPTGTSTARSSTTTASTPFTRCERRLGSDLASCPIPLPIAASSIRSCAWSSAKAEAYLQSIDEALVRPTWRGRAAGRPAVGRGRVSQALSELIAASVDGATPVRGPRFFHYVTGGVTPAASEPTGWRQRWTSTRTTGSVRRLAARLEQISLDWLKDLFGIPADWSAVLTSGQPHPTLSAWRLRAGGGV